MENQINNICAVGKRKTSTAWASLERGSGLLLVNNQSLDKYFSYISNDKNKIQSLFLLANLKDEYDITIQLKGGGLSSQFDAASLAVAKCICNAKPESREIFKKNGLLRRDSRIKERRKYGLKKARKAPQYSKR